MFKWYLFFVLNINVWFYHHAQLIVSKQGKYGIVDQKTGDHILSLMYDTIYALPFDKHITNSINFISQSPLFACKSNDSIKIFNVYLRQFYKGVFDEIRMTSELEDKIYLFPKQYNPNHIDCIMLRKGKYWGFIGHPKSYGFHDELSEADSFCIIQPQYEYLKFVEENVYTSEQYKRKKRIVVALKDSLYGALYFEDGSTILPFKYKVPIDVLSNAYNRRGLEFLSTKGGFIPYYIARESYDSKEQYVINALGKDVCFKIDYPYEMEIYHEENEDYLYVFSKDLSSNTLAIWNYNSGEQMLHYQATPGYKISATNRDFGILKLTLYNITEERFNIIWINCFSKEELLFQEGKLNRLYNESIKEINREGERLVMRKRTIIGKVIGEDNTLKIQWLKKPLIRVSNLH